MTEQTSIPSDDLQQAEQLILQKNYDEALTIIRKHWLTHPQDLQAVRLLSRLMKVQGKTELSGNLYKLSETAEALSDDVQNQFEAGFKLIDERELQLAVLLLERCVNKMPDHSVISYELGFALMSLHRFAEAIPYFLLSGSKENDFDTQLNLCVCYTFTRNMEEAQKLLEALQSHASGEEEIREVSNRRVVLKRLERFKNKQALTPRDWLYVLYGTVLLSEPNLQSLTDATKPGITGLTTTTAGKSGSVKPSYRDVAWTLLVLEKLLMELGYEFDVIEFYSPLSRPMAEALAHKLDLPAKSFGGQKIKDRALMIMAWAPNIIGPHKSFLPNSKRRVLFAYGLGALQPLPLTPDVVAQVCDHLELPWSESMDEDAEQKNFLKIGRVDMPDQRQAAASDQILAQIAELESDPDIIDTVQRLSDYYKPKDELLVLGNPEHFPDRPEYTAEIIL